MNKLIKKLYETFGEPIGNYAGDAPSGVRNEGQPCTDCGMMPIDGKCGCETDINVVCPNCGMMPIDGKCGCEATDNGICQKCGMMPIDGMCECYSAMSRHVNEFKKIRTEGCTATMSHGSGSCTGGMKEGGDCGCGGMNEDGSCECGVKEGDCGADACSADASIAKCN